MITKCTVNCPLACGWHRICLCYIQSTDPSHPNGDCGLKVIWNDNQYEPKVKEC